MKLSSALAKLKSLKSELSRVNDYVTKSIIHFEDENPEYIFSLEEERRQKLVAEVLELKSLIAETNAKTIVEVYPKVFASIAWIILKNAELRSELSTYTSYLNTETGTLSELRVGRSKDSIKKIFASDFDKKDIRKKLKDLEEQKDHIESVMAKANMETDLLQ